MRTRLLTALALAALAAAPLSAHDFWLAAANWAPAAGTPVTITAGIGERFPTRTNFRNRDNWLGQWRVIGAKGEVPVTRDFRRDNFVMATDVTLPAPGAYLGVATISAQTIEMKGPEFTEYLKEEGLDNIIAARAAAGEAEKTTRELYARYAKIAVRNGAGDGSHLTRAAGLKAEFVPSVDPTSLRQGQSLTVQFLTDGKPVPGAAISAVSGGRGEILKAKTDSQGRATFTIDRAGSWLIKTVHMIRLPQGSAEEWESYWVTLAFNTTTP